MNPFENKDLRSGSYVEFVYSQVAGMSVGDSKNVNTGSRGEAVFRMSLRYVQAEKMNNSKFKTKKSTDGSLWVLRVK